MAGAGVMKRPLALFRCDASAAIGAGHVTRCLALAEALAESGWRAAFAIGRDTTAIVPAIAAETFAMMELRHEAKDEPAALRSRFPDGVDLLVVDHYERDAAFERDCRGWARRILVMDDGTDRDHDCDLLLDSAASDPSLYAGLVAPRARLLLGPAYALIRRSFVAQRPIALQRRNGGPVKDILVSFGATDPWNAMPAALAALACFANDVAITVAMSSRAPHLDDVRARLPPGARLVLDADMAQLMTEADLAVGAAGASAFERAVLGLPSIIVTAAENQRGLADLLIDAGAATDCGYLNPGMKDRISNAARVLVGNGQVRVRMSHAASNLIDGKGGARIHKDLLEMDRMVSV
jgi:UDP-2,4-diacetamido-2,4,6-trideoxy-beta-L-altropyranose hydrolase